MLIETYLCIFTKLFSWHVELTQANYPLLYAVLIDL